MLLIIITFKGPYKGLYDEDANQVTDNAQSINNCRTLQLKQVFLQDPHKPHILAGEDEKICSLTLEKTTWSPRAPLVPGRNLLTQAKLAMRNIKKAMAIATPLLDSNGNASRSGTNEADVHKIILDKMYIALNGNNIINDGEDLECSDAEEEAEENSNKTAIDNSINNEGKK